MGNSLIFQDSLFSYVLYTYIYIHRHTQTGIYFRLVAEITIICTEHLAPRHSKLGSCHLHHNITQDLFKASLLSSSDTLYSPDEIGGVTVTMSISQKA